jgi:hypothetical protein
LTGLCAYCPGNAATIGDGIVFDELNVDPTVGHPDGPKISAVSLPVDGQAIPATLAVTGDVLTAHAGGKTYAGVDLVGLTMTLSMDDGRAYEIRLVEQNGKSSEGSATSHVRMTFWVTPRNVVDDYMFMVRKVHRKNTADPNKSCDQVPDDGCVSPTPEFKEHLCTGRYQQEDKLWTDYRAALVFEGDSFDPRTKTDVAPSGPGWFNLACSGTAAAKMHLLRHTEAGSFNSTRPGAARQTTRDQRTTMLKAITADYCGNGHYPPWTADGTPLIWMDSRGWYPDGRPEVLKKIASGELDIEAIWGPNGALCLNVPRRNPAATAKCPDPKKTPAVTFNDVLRVCSRLPNPCDPALVQSWFEGAGGYVMSVNVPKDADYCRR